MGRRIPMKFCTKCIMPETKPGITFNEEGVCNACLYEEEARKIDWDRRWHHLEILADGIRHKKPDGYQVIVPVSGGKDSTFICESMRNLGLNVLAVCAEPCYPTSVGQANLDNLSRLGYDILVFKPNQRIMPTLLKRSLIEDGQPAGAFEFLIYAVPLHEAMARKIPLVMWGEDSIQLYGNLGSGDAMEQKDFSAVGGRDASHWITPSIVRAEDLISFQHPTKQELECAGVQADFLSHYVYWDSRRTAVYAIERGLHLRPMHDIWKTGAYWNFEQLDDEIPVISHFFKFLKFGYGRATDQACRDIRAGHATRAGGIQVAKAIDGTLDLEYVHRYCDYLSISVMEFWEIAEMWMNLVLFPDGLPFGRLI